MQSMTEISYEDLKVELSQVKSQRDYWKQEYETQKSIMKEREKNYLKTNAEKNRKILELEDKIDKLEHKQMTIFDYKKG